MRFLPALAAGSILLLSSAHACFSPKPDPAPGPSQTGAGTAVCKQNGYDWVAAATYSAATGNLPAVEATWQRGALRVVARRSTGGGTTDAIELLANAVRTTGTYPSNAGTSAPLMQIAYVDGTNTVHATNGTNRGKLTITRLDTVARIVSGTFEATVITPASTTPAVVHSLKDGHFDVKF